MCMSIYVCVCVCVCGWLGASAQKFRLVSSGDPQSADNGPPAPGKTKDAIASSLLSAHPHRRTERTGQTTCVLKRPPAMWSFPPVCCPETRLKQMPNKARATEHSTQEY